jgi:hypothetical protein
MIEGINTSTAPSGGSFDLYTGLGQVTIKKVNPTSEEFEAITGYARNINYNTIGENNLMPVRILVHNEDAGFQLVDFLLGNTPVVSSTGKTQYISTKGNFTYGASEDAITSNPNMSWFGEIARPAFVGEENIISFFKQGLGIDKDTEFLNEIINKAQYNPASIYSGNADSLNFLANIFTQNQMSVIVPFGVKETVNSEGQNRNYQQVVTKGNCFFHMSSMNYAKKTYQKMLARQIEAGYPIKLATTVDFEVYTPEAPKVGPTLGSVDVTPSSVGQDFSNIPF